MRKSLTALALILSVTGGGASAAGITVGMQLEPPNLDPTAGAAAAIDEVVYANVFEGLTRFGPDGSVLPALAESWEIAPDGLSWVFTLREGVTFHDGLPMTAEDVAFSFERAMAEDSTNAQKQLFEGINSVNVIDDRTVEIGLDTPKGALLWNLAWGDAVIVSPASAETNATDPVGTGPFRFERWVQGDQVELVRNDGILGRAGGARRGDVQVHLRSDRRLRGDDGGGHRRVPELPGAGEPGAVPGRSALLGDRRHDRGRDDPRDEQRAARPSTTSGCGGRWRMPSTGARSSTGRCSATARRSAAISRRITRPTRI